MAKSSSLVKKPSNRYVRKITKGNETYKYNKSLICDYNFTNILEKSYISQQFCIQLGMKQKLVMIVLERLSKKNSSVLAMENSFIRTATTPNPSSKATLLVNQNSSID